jgi:hypothetical protein
VRVAHQLGSREREQEKGKQRWEPRRKGRERERRCWRGGESEGEVKGKGRELLFKKIFGWAKWRGQADILIILVCFIVIIKNRERETCMEQLSTIIELNSMLEYISDTLLHVSRNSPSPSFLREHPAKKQRDGDLVSGSKRKVKEKGSWDENTICTEKEQRGGGEEGPRGEIERGGGIEKEERRGLPAPLILT